MDNEHFKNKNYFEPGCETEQGCKDALFSSISSFSKDELSVVNKAYEFSHNAHINQKRQSGQPYIVHPLSVAKILADLGLDYQSIAAALLHDVDIMMTFLKGEEIQYNNEKEGWPLKCEINRLCELFGSDTVKSAIKPLSVKEIMMNGAWRR